MIYMSKHSHNTYLYNKIIGNVTDTYLNNFCFGFWFKDLKAGTTINYPVIKASALYTCWLSVQYSWQLSFFFLKFMEFRFFIIIEHGARIIGVYCTLHAGIMIFLVCWILPLSLTPAAEHANFLCCFKNSSCQVLLRYFM